MKYFRDSYLNYKPGEYVEVREFILGEEFYNQWKTPEERWYWKVIRYLKRKRINYIKPDKYYGAGTKSVLKPHGVPLLWQGKYNPDWVCNLSHGPSRLNVNLQRQGCVLISDNEVSYLPNIYLDSGFKAWVQSGGYRRWKIL